MATSNAAPIAMPSESQSARLSVAAPTATPIVIPRPMPEAFGGLLGAKSSEVEADDLWVV